MPDLDRFLRSISSESPEKDWSDELKAMWHLKKGELEKAHQLVMDLTSKTAFEIHGIVHQLEADHWNANYWYDRAGAQHHADTKIATDQLLNKL
jgi:hypothetical protein